MNDMYRAADIAIMEDDISSTPEWHCFSSTDTPWEEGKTVQLRGDFKTNATLAQKRGLPETVRFVRWFNQSSEPCGYRSHVELEVLDATPQLSCGETFLLSRSKAFIAYYVPVVF